MFTIKNNQQSDKNKRQLLKNFDIREFLNRDSNLTRLLIIMILVFSLMGALKPDIFLSLDNFSSMAFQFPEFGIIAIGMMLAILTGGIDLSMVGIANLSGILAALVLVKQIPKNASPSQIIFAILIAIVVSIATGVVCGLINGFLISIIGIPAILATLGTMQFFSGIGIAITKGSAVFGFPDQFTNLGTGSLWIIPIPAIIFAAFAVIFSFFLRKTSFGHKLYMMGTNKIASKFSGIDNTKLLIKTYMYSGLLAATAGLIIAARTNSAKADYGTSYTLQAVLVAVMGGVNPNGGFGKITGVVMSILTLQFLSSGFNIMRVSNFFKDFVWGAVLIIVMVVNYVINTKQAKKLSKNS